MKKANFLFVIECYVKMKSFFTNFHRPGLCIFIFFYLFKPAFSQNIPLPPNISFTSPQTVVICGGNNIFSMFIPGGNNFPQGWYTFDVNFTFSYPQPLSASVPGTIVNMNPFPDCISNPNFVLPGGDPLSLMIDINNTSPNCTIPHPIFTLINAQTHSYQLTFYHTGNNDATISFNLMLDCSLIPTISNNPAFSQLFINQEWLYAGILLPAQPTAPLITYPSLTGLNTVHADGNFGQDVFIDFNYQNIGTATADIDFNFTDLYLTNGNCSNFAYSQINIAYITSATLNPTCVNPPCTTYTNGPFTNVQVLPNEFLIIRYHIKITDCLNVCNAPPQVELKWKCHNSTPTSCNECQDVYITDILFDVEPYTYSVTRENPGINAAQYDITCFGQTPTQWEVKVKNTMNKTLIPKINVRLDNPTYGANGLSVVYGVTPSNYSCNTCTATPILGTSNGTTACGPSLPWFDVEILDLNYGESVNFTFDIYKCCNGSVAPGSNIAFNQWAVTSYSTNSCNLHIPPVINDLDLDGLGHISTHGFSKDDLLPNINYTPNGPLDIVVPVVPCTPSSNFGPFTSVQHVKIQGMFGDDQYDKQLLGYNPPGTPGISGLLQVDLFCQQGLRVNNMNNDVLLTYLGNNLNPETLLLKTAYQTSNPANCEDGHYYFYYDLGNNNIAPADVDNFFKTADFQFKLQTCCPNAAQVHYTTSLSLVANEINSCFTYSVTPNNSPGISCTTCCWLPLESLSYYINVHCPGCLAPGIIVDSYELLRNSFGYEDGDDNRVANGNAPTPITNTSPNPNPYNKFDNLNKHASVYGDELIDRLTAHFEPGNRNLQPLPPCLNPVPNPDYKGYDYAVDMYANNIFLRVLQLNRTMQYSEGDKMNLQIKSVRFFVEDSNPTPPNPNTLCIECYNYPGYDNGHLRTLFEMNFTGASILTNLVERPLSGGFDGASFLYTITQDLIQNNPPPPGVTITDHFGTHANFEFLERQHYRMEVFYQVCGNINETSQAKKALQSIAVIDNNMWLTGENPFSLALNNFPVAMPNLVYSTDPNDNNTMAKMHWTLYDPPNPPYPCLNCSTISQDFANDFRFFCETCGNTHTFYTTELYTSGVVGEASKTGTNCNNELTIRTSSNIGGGFYGDVFPFEYRPTSLIPTQWKFNVPAGYASPSLNNNNSTINSLYYNPAQTFPGQQCSTLVINGGVNTTLNFNSPINLLGPPYFLKCLTGQGFPSNNTELYFADGLSLLDFHLKITPDCTIDPGTITPFLSGDFDASFDNNADCGLYNFINSPFPRCLTGPFNQLNLAGNSFWSKLNPDLHIKFLPAVVKAEKKEICFDFEIWNPNTSTAITNGTNIFMVLPQLNWLTFNAPTVNTDFTYGGQPIAIPTLLPNGILQITTNLPVDGAKVLKGHICAEYSPCQPPDPQITFDWGWNCDGFPTVLPLAVCNDQINHATVTIKNTDVDVVAVTNKPPTFTPCTTYTATVCFKNNDEGAVIPNSLFIAPAGPFAINQVWIKNCNNGNAVALGNSGQYNLSTYLAGAGIPDPLGYMVQGECICFEIEYMIECTFEEELTLPLCSLTWTTYCGDVKTSEAQFGEVVWSGTSNCNDCYKVTKTADPVDIIQNQQPVTFTITVSSNNANASTVDLFDLYPCGPFDLTNDPFSGGGSINTIQVQCTTGVSTSSPIVITGKLSQTGTCINHAELTTGEFGEATVNVHSDCSNTCFIVGKDISSINYFSDPTINGGIANCNDITINGTLIIDITAFINLKVFRMNPGSEIIVNPGVSLSLYDCNLFACDGFMWRGISLHNSIGGLAPGAALVCVNTNIYDAQNATTINNFCRAYIYRCNFVNNYVGINIPPPINWASTLQMNQITLWIAENTFTGSGTLALPYLNQSPVPSALWPFAGIWAHSANLNINQQGGLLPNTFEGLSNGIVTYRSNLNVENCKFTNIQADNSYNDYRTAALFGNQFNGTAIYGRSVKGAYEIKQKGFGKPITSDLSFKNCNYMIYGDQISVTSTENRTIRLTHAYRVTAGAHFNIRLSHNSLDTYENTIDLLHNDGSLNTIVWDNDITFGDINATLLTPQAIAINVQEAGVTNINSRIHYNNIEFRAGASNAHTGILIQGARNYFVTENILNMNNNDYNFNGIALNGCFNATTSCNEITGNSDWDVLDQCAIKSEMGGDPVIGCNTTNGTENGIFMIGPQTGFTDIMGNNILNHTIGLHYSSSCVTNKLVRRGNIWPVVPPNPGPPTGNGNGFRAFNENPNFDPINDFHEVNPNNNIYYYPTEQYPHNWFQPTPGFDFICEDYSVNPPKIYCNNFPYDCPGCRTSLDDRIASDNIDNNPYTDETRWMLARGLYKKIENNPSLLTDSNLSAFYFNRQSTTIEDFQQIEDNINSLYQLDSIGTTLVELNQNTIFQMVDDINYQMMLFKTAIDSGINITSILNTITNIQDSIATVTEVNDSILSDLNVTKLNNTDQIISDVNSLKTMLSTPIETNEQVVNELYLSTIGKDIFEFTPAQNAILHDIASQCPMTGGNAVFRARALYALVSGKYIYNDRLNCETAGINYRQAQPEKPIVRVYPNPAYDKVTLEYIIEQDAKAEFIITDAIGKNSGQYQLSGRQTNYDFDISSFAPGLYYFIIKDSDGIVDNGKIVIIR